MHLDRAAMEPPLVSVVIAAYRRDDLLAEALTDAVQQTYPLVEIIVADDANSAATKALTERVEFARVCYRANPRTLGPAGNHWAAFRAARGAWISILNHDDRWDAAFLARVMAAVKAEPDAVVGFCDHHVIDLNGRRDEQQAALLASRYGRDRLPHGRQPSAPALVVHQTIPLAMGAVFRKDALNLDELPTDAGPAYDFWLAYLLARSGGAAVYVPERLTSWRAHGSNLTSSAGLEWIRGTAACWAAMAADQLFRSDIRTVQEHASRAHAALARCHLTRGDKKAARAAAWSALEYQPHNYRALALLLLAGLPRVWDAGNVRE